MASYFAKFRRKGNKTEEERLKEYTAALRTSREKERRKETEETS